MEKWSAVASCSEPAELGDRARVTGVVDDADQEDHNTRRDHVMS
jgi:hypothetical protein